MKELNVPRLPTEPPASTRRQTAINLIIGFVLGVLVATFLHYELLKNKVEFLEQQAASGPRFTAEDGTLISEAVLKLRTRFADLEKSLGEYQAHIEGGDVKSLAELPPLEEELPTFPDADGNLGAQ